MASTVEDIVSALRVISQVNLEVLERSFLDDKVGFLSAHTKLRDAVRHSKRPNTLFSVIRRDIAKIEKYLNLSEEEAVGKPVWNGVDVWLLDIQTTSQTSLKDKFRCFLGERSLALECESWGKKKYGTSRVDELVEKITTIYNKHGHNTEFLAERFPEVGKGDPMTNALRQGQKILYLERQNPGHCALSMILSFRRSYLQGISYPDLKASVQSLLCDAGKSETLSGYQSYYHRSLCINGEELFEGRFELRPFKRQKTGSASDASCSRGLSAELYNASLIGSSPQPLGRPESVPTSLRPWIPPPALNNVRDNPCGLAVGDSTVQQRVSDSNQPGIADLTLTGGTAPRQSNGHNATADAHTGVVLSGSCQPGSSGNGERSGPRPSQVCSSGSPPRCSEASTSTLEQVESQAQPWELEERRGGGDVGIGSQGMSANSGGMGMQSAHTNIGHVSYSDSDHPPSLDTFNRQDSRVTQMVGSMGHINAYQLPDTNHPQECFDLDGLMQHVVQHNISIRHCSVMQEGGSGIIASANTVTSNQQPNRLFQPNECALATGGKHGFSNMSTTDLINWIRTESSETLPLASNSEFRPIGRMGTEQQTSNLVQKTFHDTQNRSFSPEPMSQQNQDSLTPTGIHIATYERFPTINHVAQGLQIFDHSQAIQQFGSPFFPTMDLNQTLDHSQAMQQFGSPFFLSRLGSNAQVHFKAPITRTFLD
ncbi:hypothetical protein LOZ66_002974 [Ophidiomyces ophidiicola]|nr:hypothetical protein LOZ66_002974 [Ophidiomyces ophidiicola]